MNTRQLSLFASLSTLDFMLGFFPFISLLVGYLMLPMFRILMGWRLTIWWLFIGFITSLPNIIQGSTATASVAPTVISNPASLHLPPGIWLPYWSPFIGFLQHESGFIPPEVKAAIMVPAAIYFYIRTWKYQMKNAKRTLLQIPQLKSWGYFTQEDFEDYHHYLDKRQRLKSLRGFARLRASFKD